MHAWSRNQAPLQYCWMTPIMAASACGDDLGASVRRELAVPRANHAKEHTCTDRVRRQ